MSSGYCDLCGRWDSDLDLGVGGCCRTRQVLCSYWMETASGQKVSLVYPDPSTILIEDISFALSRQARFNGHSRGEPYSVARHSLWVSRYLEIVRPELALHGLLHDAHEAYLGDVISPVALSSPPVKKGMSELKARLNAAIAEALELPSLSDEQQAMIRHADLQALAAEASALMVSQGADWDLIPVMDHNARALAAPCGAPWTMDHCAFLQRYQQLRDGAEAAA